MLVAGLDEDGDDEDDEEEEVVEEVEVDDSLETTPGHAPAIVRRFQKSRALAEQGDSACSRPSLTMHLLIIWEISALVNMLGCHGARLGERSGAATGVRLRGWTEFDLEDRLIIDCRRERTKLGHLDRGSYPAESCEGKPARRHPPIRRYIAVCPLQLLQLLPRTGTCPAQEVGQIHPLLTG
jgi:hypothetical protein